MVATYLLSKQNKNIEGLGLIQGLKSIMWLISLIKPVNFQVGITKIQKTLEVGRVALEISRPKRNRIK